jgi:hypothetical protein
VERFSSAQKAVMQEEKDAAERKQRLARAVAKKAAAEAAKKVRLWVLCVAPPGIGRAVLSSAEAAPQAPSSWVCQVQRVIAAVENSIEFSSASSLARAEAKKAAAEAARKVRVCLIVH